MDSLNGLPSPPKYTSGVATPSGSFNAGPQLSQSSRRMLDLVNRLYSTGVQVDIDLPQIAVIGSQSAGKSSLIEAISGVPLPRAAGTTCTRCPTECRLLQSADAWKCVVKLRIMEDGKLSSTEFGDPIMNKTDVEDRIRRAQWAILNPTLRKAYGARHFMTGDNHGDALEQSFSNSYVSLQISGPDVPDLSFVDLPADFQNQGAQEMAKLYDPDGKRTVGVLTKPDRIPTSEEPNWVSIIRNEKERLENGWYCVKQPSSQQLSGGMTWAKASKSEDEFFTSTAVWSELDPIYQNRHDHLNKCLEHAQERIDWLVKLENCPFTLNTHYLTDYKEKFLAHFRSARENDRNPKLMSAIEEYSSTPSSVVHYPQGPSPPTPSGIAKVLTSLVEMGITGVKPEALAKLIEPDGMEPALVIMADVRAYFQVAYKRFADNVPLVIDYELIWGAERDVLGALNTGLGINGEHGDRICKELAQEASVAGRRDELVKKLERMQAAAHQLLRIGG